MQNKVSKVPVRKIIHIDMDAFYASVEQRDNPSLKGRPVVVGGSPEGRGVVAAASYEARKSGVHSAMPSSRVVKLCPEAIFIKPRFDVYKQVSAEIREIFLEYTPLVEPLSLDEAYLDVTENFRNNPSATLIAREIRKKIREKTGLTASAGVAPNKFLAKIASDLNKPDGMAVITPQKAQAFIESLPIGRFYGIGKATESKMHSLGIKTGADLKTWSRINLQAKFGKAAAFYYNIARGIDEREVRPDRIRKSVGAENTFSHDLQEVETMKQELEAIARKVAERLHQTGAAGKTVTLKVRYEDFTSITRSITFPGFIKDAAGIMEISEQLLGETEAGKRKVRLLGITVSNLNLEEKYGHQLELGFKR